MKNTFEKVRFSPDDPERKGTITCVNCFDANGNQAVIKDGSIGYLIPNTEGLMLSMKDGSVVKGPLYEFREMDPPWQMGAIADQSSNFDLWVVDDKRPNGEWVDQRIYFEEHGCDPWGVPWTDENRPLKKA